MDVNEFDLFLKHAGVKGMKWGVRKDKKKGSITRKRTTPRKLKNMSDAELKNRVSRLNLEKQLKQLEGSNRPAVVKFIGDVAYVSAKNVATQRMTKAFDSQLTNLLG